MPKTLLQIINQVQGVVGIPQSSSIFGNTGDQTSQQMLGLMQTLVTDLRRIHNWKACQWEYIIEVTPALSFTGNVGDLSTNYQIIDNIVPALSTTPQLTNWTWQCQIPGFPTPARVVAVNATGSPIAITYYGTSVTLPPNSLFLSMAAAQNTPVTGFTFLAAQDTFPIPTDFDFLQNRTMWDRTNRWELLGPDGPQMDQWHQSGIVPTGPRRHFRKLSPFGFGSNNSGSFRLWPAPYEIAANLQIVFEYISNFCIAVNGNFQPPSTGYDQPSNFSAQWTTDADQSMMDDQLLVNGLRWMWLDAKGFNYIDKKNDWLDSVDEMYARDGAKATLNLVKRVNPIFVSPANVQDGFFPGPVGPNSV